MAPYDFDMDDFLSYLIDEANLEALTEEYNDLPEEEEESED